jgi:hypothetical protein
VTNTEKTNGDSFGSGVIAGISVMLTGIILVVAIGSAIHNAKIHHESTGLIEETDIEVMLSEITSTSIRFATNEGFIIYYDGKLYVERELRD